MENTIPNYKKAIEYFQTNDYSAYEISNSLDDMYGGKGKGLTEPGVKKILDGDVDMPQRGTREKLIALYEREISTQKTKSLQISENADQTELLRIVNFVIENEKVLDNIKAFSLWKENLMKDGAIKYLTEKLDGSPS